MKPFSFGKIGHGHPNTSLDLNKLDRCEAWDVSREAFVNNEIFQLEMQRIFDRNWVFLAHETEIKQAGDFVVRALGSAPVVIVREDDAKANWKIGALNFIGDNTHLLAGKLTYRACNAQPGTSGKVWFWRVTPMTACRSSPTAENRDQEQQRSRKR